MQLDTTKQATGLFIVRYVIGTPNPGARLFQLGLAVNAVDRTVTGAGHISQAINPPLDIRTNLAGSFTEMTVMPKSTHILVVATGYPALDWPVHGGVGPVIPPNVQLRMVLQPDWKSGTANYRYLVAGQWTEADNVPVTLEHLG